MGAGAIVTIIIILIVAVFIYYLRKDTDYDMFESSSTKLIVAVILAIILVFAVLNSLPKSSGHDEYQEPFRRP